jgi:hypothetical protein
MTAKDVKDFWAKFPDEADVVLDKNDWTDLGDTPEEQLKTLFRYHKSGPFRPFVIINN